MPFPWIAAAVISAGANLAGSYFANESAKKQRKRDKRGLATFQTGQQARISDFAAGQTGRIQDFRGRQTEFLDRFRTGFGETSAAEQEYAELLQTRMKEGALPVGQLTQQVGLRVGEFAQQGRAAVGGQFANIGLGGTAASASAVGRVQAKALQAIAEQSRAIQIENELSKVSAGTEFGQLGIRQTDATRRMAEIILGTEAGTEASAFGAESRLAGDVFGAQSDLAGTVYGGNLARSGQRAASEAGFARDVTGAISETASFFGSQAASRPPITADGVTYLWDWKTNQYAPAGG